MFGLFCIVGFVLSVFAGVSLYVAGAAKRRARQNTVLWMLAIATERNQPLSEEVKAMADGFRGRTQLRLLQLADMLEGGVPLHTALAQNLGLIPHFAVVAAQVGAQNGSIGNSLRDAALRFTNDAQRRGTHGQSQFAAVYLIAVPLTSILIVSFMAVFIVPKLKKIFEDFGAALPRLTTMMFGVFDWFTNYWYLLLPILLLAPVAVVYAMAGVYRGWGELRYPFVGRWLIRFDTPELLRIIAATVEADGRFDDVLAEIGRTHRRRHVRRRAAAAAEAVAHGANAWDALETMGLLNRAEAELLDSAERVGNLPWAARTLAESLERRRALRFMLMRETLLPGLVVCLGVLVAMIVIPSFLPLVKLLSDIVQQLEPGV